MKKIIAALKSIFDKLKARLGLFLTCDCDHCVAQRAFFEQAPCCYCNGKGSFKVQGVDTDCPCCKDDTNGVGA